MSRSKYSGLVLDVANQRGGAQPGVVTLHDASRYENHGAMANVTWTQLPSGLWVMDLVAASSQYIINTPFNTVLEYPFTVTVWFSQDFTHNGCLIGLFGSGAINRMWGVDVNADRVRLYATNAFFDVGSIDISSGYHFACGVFTDDTTRYLYVDGVLEASLTDNVPTDNIDTWAMGMFRDSTPGGPLDGKLARGKIYNYPLSAGQVLKIFEAERKDFGV